MMRLERVVCCKLILPGSKPPSALFFPNHRWPDCFKPIPGEESSGDSCQSGKITLQVPGTP
jgi:hypothetical protein